MTKDEHIAILKEACHPTPGDNAMSNDRAARYEQTGYDRGMHPSVLGAWVRYEDHATALAEAQATIARQQVMLDRAEAEIVRLKDPRTAARLICDEVLQKSSDEAAEMREAMVKATMGTKVPALTGEVRWSVVNDALRALAALSRPHATKGDEG